MLIHSGERGLSKRGKIQLKGKWQDQKKKTQMKGDGGEWERAKSSKSLEWKKRCELPEREKNLVR